MFYYLNYLLCCSDRLGALHRVGRFSLDPATAPPMFYYLNYLFCCNDRLGALRMVGRLSLDPATVPTYVLLFELFVLLQ